MQRFCSVICVFLCLLSAHSFAGSATSTDQMPGTVTWALTQRTHALRETQTATLLPDGRVLVAGGSIPTYAELYDPVTDTWAETPSMGYGVSLATATLLQDGRVLIAGGISDGGLSTTRAALYDPVSGTWSQTGDLNDPANIILRLGCPMARCWSQAASIITITISPPAKSTTRRLVNGVAPVI